MMSVRLAVFLSGALLASGCEVTSELGKPCVLVKRDPADTNSADGVSSTPVLEGEIAPNQDFISFGATDCDDLICVRDADSPRNTDPNATALGYCSQECNPKEPKCEVTDTSVDEALRTRIECRSLLLDETSLDALKREDPDAYRNTFGETNSPYFCVGKLSTLPE